MTVKIIKISYFRNFNFLIFIFKKVIKFILPVIFISNIILISQTIVAGIDPKEFNTAHSKSFF